MGENIVGAAVAELDSRLEAVKQLLPNTSGVSLS